jgi:hypothetical protein
MSIGIHQFLRSLTGTCQPEARACMSRLAVNVRMKMRQAKKLKDKSERQYQDASR